MNKTMRIFNNRKACTLGKMLLAEGMNLWSCCGFGLPMQEGECACNLS